MAVLVRNLQMVATMLVVAVAVRKQEVQHKVLEVLAAEVMVALIMVQPIRVAVEAALLLVSL
jgi:hypothetical protein